MTVELALPRAAPAAASWQLLGAPLQKRYRDVLRRLGWLDHSETPGLQTLGVTSAAPGEGVSTVAAHLAAVAAAVPGREVLLVDTNFDAPSHHHRFAVPARPGLAELLQSGGDTPTAIHATALPNLSILPAGKTTGKASRLHDVLELAAGIKELSADFDLVVFDLPPAGMASLSLRFASVLDGTLLVVESARTTRDAVQRTLELLRRARATVVGTVFNKHNDRNG
jgi:capsular exopolysaccharide synthesis family protein